MSLAVRAVDGLSEGEARSLVADHPYGEWRRYARIAPEAASEHLATLLSRAAGAGDARTLLAVDGDRPAGCLVMAPLPHDTAILGRPMGGVPFALVRADVERPRAVYDVLLERLPALAAEAGLVHLSARLDTSNLAGYQAFTDAGFRLMETLVTLSYDTARRGTGTIDPAEYGFDGVVRPVEAGDLDAVAELAARSFTLNRYHLDEQIPRERAGELMGRWARSYCEDAADAQVWVAEGAGGKLAGFLGHRLDRELEERAGVLVSGRALLAVADPRTRVGQMLSRAHTWQSRGDHKEADTQLDNYGMIKVAFNLDMDLVRTKYTFHLGVD